MKTTDNTARWYDTTDNTTWKPVTVNGRIGFECIETGEIRGNFERDLTVDDLETFWNNEDMNVFSTVRNEVGTMNTETETC